MLGGVPDPAPVTIAAFPFTEKAMLGGGVYSYVELESWRV